jgi:hypothetical protein
MSTWWRVFGMNDVQAEPAAIEEQARFLCPRVEGQYSGDDQGLIRAEFRELAEEPVVLLERFLAEEEGIRGQMNTWAAWLETVESSPYRERLMQQVINTRQLFTLRGSQATGESRQVDELCTGLCRFLAKLTGGVYQVDERGFFDADGKLLVEERAS